MDVDSAIYQYTTQEASEADFWDSVISRARDHDWRLVEHARQFERIVAATGKQMFHSAEEVRVAYDLQTRTVTVAWVQADERQLPKRFPQSGPEGGFAQRVIWPKFEELAR
jgi:hypothetical protein